MRRRRRRRSDQTKINAPSHSDETTDDDAVGKRNDGEVKDRDERPEF